MAPNKKESRKKEYKSITEIVSPVYSKNYTCKYCGMNFPTSNALGGHQNSHPHRKDKAADDTEIITVVTPDTAAKIPSSVGNYPSYSPYFFFGTPTALQTAIYNFDILSSSTVHKPAYHYEYAPVTSNLISEDGTDFCRLQGWSPRGAAATQNATGVDFTASSIMATGGNQLFLQGMENNGMHKEEDLDLSLKL